jgi:preprotein translocase subunit YajC
LADKIKPGDEVVLTGRVTRVDDSGSIVMVTVKLEGYATPVTVRVEFVRKA